MGASIAWLAVRTNDHATLFDKARVAPAGAAKSSGSITGVQLEGGWFLLMGDGCDHRLIDPGLLASISSEAACVACSIEEHVMFSSASYWREGVEVWSVAHDAQRGGHDLEATGELPEIFTALRERTFDAQRAEDSGRGEVDFVFDLPLILAQDLTGFKHDEERNGHETLTPTAFEDLSGGVESRPSIVTFRGLAAAVLAGLVVAAWLRFDQERLLMSWLFLLALFVGLFGLVVLVGATEPTDQPDREGSAQDVIAVAGVVFLWLTLLVLALVPPTLIPGDLLPGWPRFVVVLAPLAGIAVTLAISLATWARVRRAGADGEQAGRVQ